MNMGTGNGELDNELLQAHAHVWSHVFRFISSMSLKCAIDLGIPDIIQNHGKPMTITELVAALPMLNSTKACNIYRLMRVLAHSGFFAHQKLDGDAQKQGYVLTNSSRMLLKNNPLSIAPILKAALDPILIKPWTSLGAWFQNDDGTPFETAHGKILWDYCSQDPQLNDSFNECQASDSRLITTFLVDKCKGVFEGLNSLVDVGGGIGIMAKSLVDVFPHLACTVFDLPHVVAGLQGSKKLKYVGGDMFKTFPTADAILFKTVLHNWKDEECVTILKRCKEAISSGDKVGGKVIIIDMVLRENEEMNEEVFKSSETKLLIDMQMLAMVNGKERVEEEWNQLFLAAGFSYYKITPIVGLKSLIEVYP